MKNDIEFIEDKEILSPLPPENEIKGKSIEGWIYKNIPGAINRKKMILVFLIIIMFAASFYFILLAYLNTSEDRIREEFDSKVSNS